MFSKRMPCCSNWLWAPCLRAHILHELHHVSFRAGAHSHHLRDKHCCVPITWALVVGMPLAHMRALHVRLWVPCHNPPISRVVMPKQAGRVWTYGQRCHSLIYIN